MSDITMCHDYECPMRETCHRYMAEPNPLRQCWFTNSPRDGEECDHHMQVTTPTEDDIVNTPHITESSDADLVIMVLYALREIDNPYNWYSISLEIDRRIAIITTRESTEAQRGRILPDSE